MDRYEPFEIEKKWQEFWERNKNYKVTEDANKKKYYLLEMFPYPSGKIHMGHVRNYTIGDVIARYKMMCGFNVLHPMGWDAFGMPAENAAIANGTHPAAWTYKNIETMKKQLIRMGFSYDWSREFATCDITYYRWEQWLFLKMLDNGLVYRKKSFVNWCGSCQTVLANEQVEAGLCWRCKSEVTQKELYQWFFRITSYTEELLEYCDKLSGWPEKVTTMQKNWIGKSEGAEIIFPLQKGNGHIKVFTTRPDTIYGATFMSLAPENPLSVELSMETPREKAVKAFIEKNIKQDKAALNADDFEKEGVFTGSYCLNPLTGSYIPIYVANFVLMEYGTGAVMAVPTHDQRDFEFAKKYGLSLKVVITPKDKELIPEDMTEAYEDSGIMVNSGHFNGMENEKAAKEIVKYLEEKGLGSQKVTFRLRDWGISRQRYWGNPIPIIHCDNCGAVPVPEDDLPVILPDDVNLTLIGRSPLADNPDFVNIQCPTCKRPAKRETDTMDTFVESSWYFARYACPLHNASPLDKEKVSYWLPVDQYIGGVEHAVLHLLYARFFTRVLRDLGIIEFDEPFTNLLTQGMVCKESFKCPLHGWLYPEEVKEKVCTYCGQEITIGRVEKMSKSVKNVVDPESLIEKYGADTARLFCLFAAPPERDLEWSDKGVEGCFRFLSRLWRAITENREKFIAIEPFDGSTSLSGDIKDLRRKTHLTIKRVTSDIEERFHFNTAISSIMELLNMIYQFEIPKINDLLILRVLKEAFQTILLLLYPMVPHICEELWERLGNPPNIMNIAWPSYADEVIKAEEVTIVIQINGKVRSRIMVPLDAAEEEIKKIAFSDPKVKERIKGKEIEKTILIPQKLLSIVVR